LGTNPEIAPVERPFRGRVKSVLTTITANSADVEDVQL